MGKTEQYVLYGLLVLVLAGLIYSLSDPLGSSGEKSDKPDNVVNPDKMTTVSTGSTDEGDVAIDLTPSKVTNGRLSVEISVNTHSVDLSPYDLEKITILEYGGKTIYPESAPDLSGHHASGTIIFKVEDDLNEFRIRIRGIPKVEERLFEWR